MSALAALVCRWCGGRNLRNPHGMCPDCGRFQ